MRKLPLLGEEEKKVTVFVVAEFVQKIRSEIL